MANKLKSTRTPMPEFFERIPISTRYSTLEKAYLKKQAVKFTGGKVSEYIRYASLFFKPSKKDFES